MCAGLASAMYMREGQEVPNPDSASGLYIRDQSGKTVQVKVPADQIAFQMGEAMQACNLNKPCSINFCCKNLLKRLFGVGFLCAASHPGCMPR